MWKQESNVCPCLHMAFFPVSVSSPLLIKIPVIGCRAHPKSRMIPSWNPYLIRSAKTIFLNKITFWSSGWTWGGGAGWSPIWPITFFSVVKKGRMRSEGGQMLPWALLGDAASLSTCFMTWLCMATAIPHLLVDSLTRGSSRAAQILCLFIAFHHWFPWAYF